MMLILLAACTHTTDPIPAEALPPAASEPALVAPEPAPAPAPPAPPPPQTVRGVFPPPEGSQRLEADAFGLWLGERPVMSEDTPILTYAGGVVPHNGRVVELPLVPGDLQQCADSAIRLRAEWLREQGREAEIIFHATSGDPVPWPRYRDGERPYAQGNKLYWRKAGPGAWDDYLAAVFMWAGTMSLAYDTQPSAAPRAGDILVTPGSPGHAVVLMDVAEDAQGLLVLVGEGYMPAQSFHIEQGPLSGWWRWDDGVKLPHWTLPASGLRRW